MSETHDNIISNYILQHNFASRVRVLKFNFASIFSPKNVPLQHHKKDNKNDRTDTCLTAFFQENLGKLAPEKAKPF